MGTGYTLADEVALDHEIAWPEGEGAFEVIDSGGFISTETGEEAEAAMGFGDAGVFG